MNFTVAEAIEILERTPRALTSMLSGLSESWLQWREGEGTWTVHEVVNHLIENEKKNWVPRMETILQGDGQTQLPDFDRYSHIDAYAGYSVDRSLQEFAALRAQNINVLNQRVNLERHLEWTAVHPAFGKVKLRELLSTWVVHDLTHTAQIVRVVASRYRADVGPWIEYLGILKMKK
ncbi:DinB family protein [Paenibacillus ginsengihumi]|jgi:uncharacterized damage-inducible protein DinB|uniref:DinB family protein n=1 Tax=Paenibacillus ginsengihumi TaxID=431596 RepID=UPI00037B3DC2|nr:DinB family protein [Paenibacillus ginsengihumi]